MIEPLITVGAAWDLLTAEIEPLPVENLPLAEAGGRCLAEAVLSDRDLPPAPRSAMDGFAARAVDLAAAPVELQVTGEVAAGADAVLDVAPGTCVRIFTGANLPAGSDCVVPVELTSSESFRVRPDDSNVVIRTALEPGANVVPKAQLVAANQEVLAVGTRLGPRQIAVAASVGVETVTVHRLPSVYVLNTGRELRDSGSGIGRHETRDSNGPLIEAALAELGIDDFRRVIVTDELDLMRSELRAAVAVSEVVLLTGGVSAGRYDFVPDTIAELGGRTVFHQVCLKPGKPQLFARMPDGSSVFGLPGNPLSVVVGLYEFVLPAMRRLAGEPWSQCRPGLRLPLAEAVEHRGGRRLMMTACLETRDEGTVVVPRPVAGSADVIGGGAVDGAFLIEPGRGIVPAGEIVTFRPWGAFLP